MNSISTALVEHSIGSSIVTGVRAAETATSAEPWWASGADVTFESPPRGVESTTVGTVRFTPEYRSNTRCFSVARYHGFRNLYMFFGLTKCKRKSVSAV